MALRFQMAPLVLALIVACGGHKREPVSGATPVEAKSSEPASVQPKPAATDKGEKEEADSKELPT